MTTNTAQNDQVIFERAGAHFTDRIHEVPDDAWGAATPCSEWDVRELVNHMVAEHLWVPDLLGGATVDEIGDRYDGDVLGDDPAAAWDAAWAASSAAWAAVGEGDTVELSRGTTPIATYREEMIIDLVVHGWDLSRGAGLDESGSPAAVARALEIASANPYGSGGSSSYFAAPVQVESDDPLVRLVAILGRQP